MNMQVRTLRDERARVTEQQRALLAANPGGLSADANTQYNALEARYVEIDTQIARLEEQDRRQAAETALQNAGEQMRSSALANGGMQGSTEDVLSREAAYDMLFRGALRYGSSVNTVPELAQARSVLQVNLDVAGGFVAASETFKNELIKAVDDEMPLGDVVHKLPIKFAETLGYPSLDGDLSEFEFGGGELVPAVEDNGIALGKRELKCFPFKMKSVPMSVQLLESTQFDGVGLVMQRAAVALGKGFNRAMLLGHGSMRPLGLFVASEQGVPTSRDVVGTNTATALSADTLLDVQDTVKPAYQAKCRWLFHRTVVSKIRQLKDGEGQYIWKPGLLEGAPDVLLGRPIVRDEMCPSTMSANLYVGMYGDFSKYWLTRSTESMQVQRLNELVAERGQVKFLFRNIGGDGMPILAEAFARIKMGA